ncbi:MAG TPA: hypothetical protein VK138_06840 [Acidiferrobacterales bacterium]|nr:hypothetical protein [Acidiferrobacterales bacterium]
MIDAQTNTWIQNVPTFGNAHSVAANARTNEVFVPLGVPLATDAPSSPCPHSCIGVYAAEDEHDD